MRANPRIWSEAMAAAIIAGVLASAPAVHAQSVSDHRGHNGGGPPAAPPPPRPDVVPPPPPPPAPSATRYTITFLVGRAVPDAAGRAHLESAEADLKELAAQNARSRAAIDGYSLSGQRFAPTNPPYFYAARIRIAGQAPGSRSRSGRRGLSRRRAETVAAILGSAGARRADLAVLTERRDAAPRGGLGDGAVTITIDYAPAS